MNFALTDEQEMIVSTVRSFVEKEIYPHEAQVERTRDFVPVNAEQRASRLMQTVFPTGSLPLDADSKADAAMEIADLLGLNYDEEGVQTAVENREGRRAQQASAVPPHPRG
mgnify:CR=1 FL=1